MKFLIATFLCAIVSLSLRGQSLTIPPDTSYILFPGNVKVMVKKVLVNGSTFFQTGRKDFKTYVTETNFYLSMLPKKEDNTRNFQKEVEVGDLKLKEMQKKYEAENQRTNNYMAELENEKRIAKRLLSELDSCKNDLQLMDKEKRKAKRANIIKAGLLGIGIGIAGGFIAGVAID